MTKTALANKEIASRESIAEKDRLVKQSEGALDRAQREKERKTKEKVAKLGIVGSAVGGVSKGVGGIPGALISAFGSKHRKNDPKWYKNYISNLETFINIPHYDRLGTCHFKSRYSAYGTTDYSIPGISIFKWVPTIGSQEEGTNYYANPANQSLARAKEKVLATNSRSNVNWDYSDLGYNFFCSVDIATLILDLKRVLQVFNTYHAKNAFLAKSLITALGWTYSMVESEYANLRKLYVKMATKFNSSIVLPSTLSLADRRMYLASNIFIDSGDVNYPRQMYAFVQGMALKLNAAGDACDMISIARTTLSGVTSQIESRFAAITDNPDFVEMYQDLRHAFGNNIVQLPTSIDGECIVFNDVELNRLQIHNLRILPVMFDDSGLLYQPTITANNWGLHQDSNGYLFQGNTSYDQRRAVYSGASSGVGPYLRGLLTMWLGHVDGMDIYNMPSESVSGDDILDITRFGFGLVEASGTGANIEYRIPICGTEVIFGSTIYSLDKSGSLIDRPFTTYFVFNTDSNGKTPLGTTDYYLPAVIRSSAFTWSPICHTGWYDTLNGVSHVETLLEAHTTFGITSIDLKAIHEACIMSELYIPDVTFVR